MRVFKWFWHLLFGARSLPNDEVEATPRYCAMCGLGTEFKFVDFCTGCSELVAACICTKRDCCIDAGTADAAACCRREIGIDADAELPSVRVTVAVCSGCAVALVPGMAHALGCPAKAEGE